MLTLCVGVFVNNSTSVLSRGFSLLLQYLCVGSGRQQYAAVLQLACNCVCPSLCYTRSMRVNQQHTTQSSLSHFYPCWHLVVSHVQLHLVDAHLLAVEDASSKGGGSASGLEHLHGLWGSAARPSQQQLIAQHILCQAIAAPAIDAHRSSSCQTQTLRHPLAHLCEVLRCSRAAAGDDGDGDRTRHRLH